MFLLVKCGVYGKVTTNIEEIKDPQYVCNSLILLPPIAYSSPKLTSLQRCKPCLPFLFNSPINYRIYLCIYNHAGSGCGSTHALAQSRPQLTPPLHTHARSSRQTPRRPRAVHCAASSYTVRGNCKLRELAQTRTHMRIGWIGNTTTETTKYVLR